MSLSNRDRQALEGIESQLTHEAPELTALFRPADEGAGDGPGVGDANWSTGLGSRLAFPWQTSTALAFAVVVQLLAAAICMSTQSLLLVVTMLGVVAASLIPLAHARA